MASTDEPEPTEGTQAEAEHQEGPLHLTLEMAAELFTSSPQAQTISEFLADTALTIEQKFKSLIKARQFSTLKLWFQPTEGKTIILDYLIGNWSELIRSLVAASFIYPQWNPPIFMDVNIPLYLGELFAAYNSEDGDPSTVSMFPQHTVPLPLNEKTSTTGQPSSSGAHGTTKPKGKDKKSTQPTEDSTPPTGPSNEVMLELLMKMQQKLDRLEQAKDKSSPPSEASTHKSATPSTPSSSTPSPSTTAEEFQLQMIKTLKVMQGEEADGLPPPTKVHAKHVVQELISIHDYPMNSHKQRAATSIAKVLLHFYDLGLPMAQGQDWHDAAHQLTNAIKDILYADAFPRSEPPMLKGRKNLLATVLSNQITKKELSEAYTPAYSGYYNKSNRGNHNSWRGGRGDYGRGGRSNYSTRGRGRGGRSSQSSPPATSSSS